MFRFLHPLHFDIHIIIVPHGHFLVLLQFSVDQITITPILQDFWTRVRVTMLQCTEDRKQSLPVK